MYKMATYKIKLPELRQILKDNNIEGYYRCNKTQLIELLRERGLLHEEVTKKLNIRKTLILGLKD